MVTGADEDVNKVFQTCYLGSEANNEIMMQQWLDFSFRQSKKISPFSNKSRHRSKFNENKQNWASLVKNKTFCLYTVEHNGILWSLPQETCSSGQTWTDFMDVS